MTFHQTCRVRQQSYDWWNAMNTTILQIGNEHITCQISPTTYHIWAIDLTYFPTTFSNNLPPQQLTMLNIWHKYLLKYFASRQPSQTTFHIYVYCYHIWTFDIIFSPNILYLRFCVIGKFLMINDIVIIFLNIFLFIPKQIAHAWSQKNYFFKS